MIRPILFGLLAMLASANVMAATCDAGDMTTLKSCVNNKTLYDTIRLTNDISCTGTSCCPSGSTIVLNFNMGGTKAQDLTIDGQNFAITTTDITSPTNQGCIFWFMQNPENVTIKNLTIKDSGSYSGPCINTSGQQVCANTMYISKSAYNASNPPVARDVTLDNVHVLNSQANGVTVAGIDGFTFINSTIQGSGIHGLYIGGRSLTSVPDIQSMRSRRVLVQNSRFIDNRVNGLVLEGIGYSTSAVTDSKVLYNLFMRNHWAGGFWINGGPPFSNGGQMYVSEAIGLTVNSNDFTRGRCDTCNSTDIWGVELGHAGNPGVHVSNTSFWGNHFSNLKGSAFFKNTDFNSVPTSLNISATTLMNVSLGLSYPNSTNNVPPARVTGTTTLSIPWAAQNGLASHNVYRLYVAGQGHKEAATNYTGGTPEAIFVFSPTPRTSPMAPARWRCKMNGSNYDFLSTDRNCEGQTRVEPLGFSYEPGYPGSSSVHRCMSSSTNHFFSWSSTCEGQTNQGVFGTVLNGM